MFPYDAVLLAAAAKLPESVADVLATMQTIEATCVDGDGLKWFNWLYFEVTRAVEARIAGGGFADPQWLAELDVQFARLYFGALAKAISGQAVPSCWQVLFANRSETPVARIQFAMAGINAHINHDLAQALVATWQASGTNPQSGDTNYNDYTALNTTLDSLIESAKQTLHIRLLGALLPPVSHWEDTVAAWSVSAARESAWQNAELLWHLRDTPLLATSFLDTLDGLSTLAGKSLMVPVP
jgi:hypothetical protein